MFKLPLLNILDELKDEDGISYLQKVVSHLIVEGERSTKEVAVTLGISESIVRRLIPEHIKKEAKKIQDEKTRERDDLIIDKYDKGDHPKSISFDLDIPMHTIYRILRRHRKEKADNFTV